MVRQNTEQIIQVGDDRYRVCLFSNKDGKGILRYTVKYHLLTKGCKLALKDGSRNWQQFQLSCKEKSKIVQGYIDSNDRWYFQKVDDFLYEPLRKILYKRIYGRLWKRNSD